MADIERINLSEKAQSVGEKIDNGRTEKEIKDLIRKKESQIKSVCALKDDINVVRELKHSIAEAHDYSSQCIEATEHILNDVSYLLLIK